HDFFYAIRISVKDHFINAMSNREALKDLFERYLSGACTPEEINFLFQKFDVHADEETLRRLIKDTFLYETGNDEALQPKVTAFTERVGQRLVQEIAPPQRRIRPWMKVAAVLTAFLSIGILVYFQVQKVETVATGSETSAYGGEVSPGGNRATLTLANGEVVDLSSAHAGIVVEDEIVYADGTSVGNTKTREVTSSAPQPLTLTTPK